MKNILAINLELYHLHVVVVFGSPIEEVIETCISRGATLSENWIKWVKVSAATANGFCANIGDGNTDVLVWLKKELNRGHKASDYGVLFHELFHAVDKITNSHALEGELECRAYIYEYLAEACFRYCWVKPAFTTKTKKK